MLSKKALLEIKSHLEKAQNPIFFFDNDQDGLCSFLLLQRTFGRGKGVAIKSFPDLNEGYFRKVEELNSDYIFVLDKPVISDGFLERVKEKNIPFVWIDHHDVDSQKFDFINYYNSFFDGDKKGEPVTAICYEISEKKEDIWIGVVGCIADGFLPHFYRDFCKEYPELSIESDKAFDVLYKARIGEVARIFGAGLKDTTSNVVSMVRFLVKARSPYDIFEENSKNRSFHKRFKQVSERYSKLFSKAVLLAENSENFVFFKYSGDLSVSGELSTELCYLFPKKKIAVVYVNGNKATLSLRGAGIRDILVEAIDGFQGASGGGHKDAVGGQIQEKDIEEFKKRLERLINKS